MTTRISFTTENRLLYSRNLMLTILTFVVVFLIFISSYDYTINRDLHVIPPMKKHAYVETMVKAEKAPVVKKINTKKQPPEKLTHKKRVLKQQYLILLYTNFFGQRPWPFARKDYFSACPCDVKNCNLTYDLNLVEQADVLIFHGRRDMTPGYALAKLHKRRTKEQRWAYFILENPMNAPDVVPLDRYFNWTISYRLNSDFWIPYNEIQQLKNKNLSSKDYAIGKTKKIAWFVSHCGKSRDLFVKKLVDSGMQVDVGGGCASNYKHQIKCQVDHDCRAVLKQYKFYLAAENGFCKDYITEKYYKQGLLGETIPIVLGGADYHNPKLAIPGSFIDPLSFPNFKKFFEHLKKVDENDALFNEYFKWKASWKQEDDPPGCKKFICDICKRLQSDDTRKDRPLSLQIHGDCDATSRRYLEWLSKM